MKLWYMFSFKLKNTIVALLKPFIKIYLIREGKDKYRSSYLKVALLSSCLKVDHLQILQWTSNLMLKAYLQVGQCCYEEEEASYK